MERSYEYMKASQCKHDQAVAAAVEAIRTKKGLLERTADGAHIVMGCFALGIAPQLYSQTAQKVLEMAADYS